MYPAVERRSVGSWPLRYPNISAAASWSSVFGDSRRALPAALSRVGEGFDLRRQYDAAFASSARMCDFRPCREYREIRMPIRPGAKRTSWSIGAGDASRSLKKDSSTETAEPWLLVDKYS